MWPLEVRKAARANANFFCVRFEIVNRKCYHVSTTRRLVLRRHIKRFGLCLLNICLTHKRKIFIFLRHFSLYGMGHVYSSGKLAKGIELFCKAAGALCLFLPIQLEVWTVWRWMLSSWSSASQKYQYIEKNCCLSPLSEATGFINTVRGL